MLLRLPSCRHADATTPAGTVRCVCRLLPEPPPAFPFPKEGRLPHCHFRGLLGVHVTFRPVCSLSHPRRPIDTKVLQSTSLPPQTALAATNRSDNLLSGVRTHKEDAPFHGAPGNLGDEIGRCFGVGETHVLKRRGRTNAARITLRRRMPDNSEFGEHTLTLGRNTEFRAAIPAGIPIPVGHRTDDGMARARPPCLVLRK